MSLAAVLTAAGSGSRLGAGRPKALVSLREAALVVHAARRLVAASVAELAVSAPAGHVLEVETILAAGVPMPPGVRLVVVEGGPSRQASVAGALAVLSPEVDVVLVHDAARALAPVALIERVADAVRSGRDAVIPGLPVVDTVKQVERSSDGVARVVATPDRAMLRAVQTPQGFRRALLDSAHASGAHRAASEAEAATDDAALVEALGVPVWLVPGEQAAMKITTVQDLRLAELLLDQEEAL